MQNEQKPSIPLNLVALDILGVILLGVGFAKLAAGIEIIPVNFRFENYEIVSIVVGIALMIPYVSYIIRKPRTGIE